jgi:GTP-binding protein HflX
VLPQRGSAADPDALSEFAELARSAGAEVLGTLTARVDKPSPRYFIGAGKADEVKAAKETLGADLILVNHTLSPVQERNLEKLTECRVVDRTGLILDIFAQRARSHEGKLQVELAQLKHLATRLVRGWTHLERQRGGAIGLRGPGETQLETDRRLLAKRVDMLERRLDKVEVQRQQARRARLRSHVPVIALVGYTNAGKSTLFNALTQADVYAADQLFATLDPTVRRLNGLTSGPAVLADTVGFVRDLPHDLIAAFRSTLAEARDADLLLHVVDAADPRRDERIGEVQAVLEEIGAGAIPQVQVWNKIDLIDVAPRHERIDGNQTHRVWLSAARASGFDLLREAIDAHFARERVHGWLHLPPTLGRLRAKLFAAGAVAHERADDDGWALEIDAPRSLVEPLFGLPGGDGEWLRTHLGLAAPAPSADPAPSGTHAAHGHRC